jgi:hypothetical protein
MVSVELQSGLPKAALALILFLVFGLQGCWRATVFGYEPMTWALDGKSELYISTYPSEIARTVSKTPFLWKEVRSPNSVYFQVFVRQVGKSGRNPHVESITIHSFSYAFPGQEPVELIADYAENFWMQGSPDYNPDRDAPVPVHEGWYVNLKIDLTLNGQRYRFDDIANATQKEYLRPLLSEAFR